MKRTPLIAGNWKMNLGRESARELAKIVSIANVLDETAEVLLCPSHVWLADIGSIIHTSKIKLGAQDVSEHEAGAYTGEVSVTMLKELECSYVIVGHSERRTYYGDTLERVNKKTFIVHHSGLTPIVCIGETEAERKHGDTEKVIGKQIDSIINAHDIDLFRNLVIAYEPIWAIGTGLTASPEDAQKVHAFIRSKIAIIDVTIANSVRLLYGGSVKPENAYDLFMQEDIDGALVGGASLDADSFLGIYQAALSCN